MMYVLWKSFRPQGLNSSPALRSEILANHIESVVALYHSRNNILLLGNQTGCRGVQEANRCSTVGGRTVSKNKLLDSGDPVLWELKKLVIPQIRLTRPHEQFGISSSGKRHKAKGELRGKGD